MGPSLLMTRLAESQNIMETPILTSSLGLAIMRIMVIMLPGPLMNLSSGKGPFPPVRSCTTTMQPQVGRLFS